MIEIHREEASKIISGIRECKSLAKAIKVQRAAPWPCLPTADLPPKPVADQLVEYYLRTTETFYRILHVPSFERDYGALWVSDTPPDTAFLVQVKLVLAIGALAFDEQFSMRTLTIRWIYEAKTWLSGPKFKSRLGIQSLQTEILFLLARELVNIDGEPMWISAGALLRKAVFMGLHKDPTSLLISSHFAVEMRRRLWNTILEINMQSGLMLGGPPFISLDDFDTECPGNFDDDQLTAEAPTPKREDEFTNISIARAARKAFPIRLEATNFLNNFKSQGTYEETLRLDTELRAAFKALSRSLNACNSKTGPSPSNFERRVVDFIMHRYLSALHIPFFGPSLQETTYAYSRKVVVEASLKTWYAAYPLSFTTADQQANDATGSKGNDLGRLVACGSGFSRDTAWQAAILIAIELRAQLQEEESLGGIPLRPDLLSVLDDAKTWCLQCIRAGEINVKGYLLICVLTAQIKGLRCGVEKEEIPRLIIKSAEESIEECLPILKGMMTGLVGDGPNEMASNNPVGVMEDWDFMMSDDMFNLGDVDPMGWIFNDEIAQGLSL
ncbi:transcription factor lepE [Hyphodiscus hymeniophilus]|uniref:Transcription factor lepE n=1 Tax=Hyphodiscus hymeniophilus TaxID=353542 RepID=A0A9P7B0H3_9HELO|nr:transcription factor lepE [Hyphodiscus hymeniophilus]